MKNKISLIIQREYLTRVRKKSFLVMTILAPILFAAIIIVPILLKNVDKDHKLITVVDQSDIFENQLENTDELSFTYSPNIEDAKLLLTEEKTDAVLFVKASENSRVPSTATLYYAKKQPGMSMHSNIEKQMQALIRNKVLVESYQISPKEFEDINKLNIKISAQNIETGEKSNTGIKTGIGYISGLLIYMFVFLFGAQVMNGVIEEKSNRIIEVIVSSVKPFQLMAGKIIGVALVGLTQFLLWVVLTVGLVTLGGTAIAGKIDAQQMTEMATQGAVVPGADELNVQDVLAESGMFTEILESINAINWPMIIIFFIIFFIGGYLLYASLFAAIGAAVDNEADTNQFMLPITVPLIIALVAIVMVMDNPNGPVAFWLSMIPFTSPVIMMMRIPFGVPVWELCLSVALLVAGFMFTTWLAAKIYRVGILMYGKKTNYGELWKWIKYKN